MALSLLPFEGRTHHTTQVASVPGAVIFSLTALHFASHTPSGFPASLFGSGMQSWTKASRVSDPNSKAAEAMACSGQGGTSPGVSFLLNLPITPYFPCSSGSDDGGQG